MPCAAVSAASAAVMPALFRNEPGVSDSPAATSASKIVASFAPGAAGAAVVVVVVAVVVVVVVVVVGAAVVVVVVVVVVGALVRTASTFTCLTVNVAFSLSAYR